MEDRPACKRLKNNEKTNKRETFRAAKTCLLTKQVFIYIYYMAQKPMKPDGDWENSHFLIFQFAHFDASLHTLTQILGSVCTL